MTKGAAVITIVNNDAKPATVECGVKAARLADGATLRDRLGIGPDLKVEEGKITVTLPPRAASIYVERAR